MLTPPHLQGSYGIKCEGISWCVAIIVIVIGTLFCIYQWGCKKALSHGLITAFLDILFPLPLKERNTKFPFWRVFPFWPQLFERYYFWFCHCLPPSLSASNVNLSEMEKPSCYHWVSRIRERKKKSQQDNERNVGLNVTGQQSNVSTFGFTVTKEK